MQVQSGLLRACMALLLISMASLVPHRLVQSEANAAQMSLRWDYADSGADGFVLYCGPSSRNYLPGVDVGNTEDHIVSVGATSYCVVTAYDSAGVESTFSNEIALVVAAAPVVNLTRTPASGVAPLSVQFTSTTSGFTSWAWTFGDGTTGSGQNPQHTYTAAGSYNAVLTATGAGGTATNTAAITVTTPGVPPATGLVAAYSFNEGGGTTVADASGKGNTGTLNGTKWIANGRFGGALRFNATDTLTIPNSASLNLSTAMTLAAWVSPAEVSSALRDVIRKGTAYYLGATSTTGGRPAAGGSFGMAYATAPLAATKFAHLAVTYNKVTLRLYVNGVLISSVARTANIAASTTPLQIGGDSVYGGYFKGRIDEVRVYNRALSQAEIQADMIKPIAP